MSRLELSRNDSFAEYGDAQGPGSVGTPIDLHSVIKTGDVPKGVDGKQLKGSLLDVARWLPFAAEAYCISPKLDDYVLVGTLIFATEIPNANLCAFPFAEMSRWHVQSGELSYRTWARKPTHVEHANGDPTQARGVIFDSSMRPAPEYVGGLHRVVLLTGWDRNKDPERASIVSNGRTGFSMGAWVEDYACSVCDASLRSGGCDHVHPKMGPRVKEVGGRLVYRVARGVQGFEISSVASPAFRQAMAEAIG